MFLFGVWTRKRIENFNHSGSIHHLQKLSITSININKSTYLRDFNGRVVVVSTTVSHCSPLTFVVSRCEWISSAFAFSGGWVPSSVWSRFATELQFLSFRFEFIGRNKSSLRHGVFLFLFLLVDKILENQSKENFVSINESQLNQRWRCLLITIVNFS